MDHHARLLLHLFIQEASSILYQNIVRAIFQWKNNIFLITEEVNLSYCKGGRYGGSYVTEMKFNANEYSKSHGFLTLWIVEAFHWRDEENPQANL